MDSPASALSAPVSSPESVETAVNAVVRRVILQLPLLALLFIGHATFVVRNGHFMGPHSDDELPPLVLWAATAALALVIGVTLLGARRAIRRVAPQVGYDTFGARRLGFARTLFVGVLVLSAVALFVSFSLAALFGDGGRLAIPFLLLVG